jgi:hypothetical protein
MGDHTRTATNTGRIKKRVVEANRETTQRTGGKNASRKPWLQGLDWNVRYGNIWEYKKKVAGAHKHHSEVLGVCVVCMVRPCTTMHHTEYGVDEELGYNWFPVCNNCHNGKCHHSKNWIKHPTNPRLLNHNTEEFVGKLRFNWRLLYEGTQKDP